MFFGAGIPVAQGAAMKKTILLIGSIVSLLVFGCSAASTEPTGSADDELRGSRAPSCKTVGDCSNAFDDGTWKISSARVDECVQKQDQPYYCMKCNTNHKCSFDPNY
jgi:hypothetical protein